MKIFEKYLEKKRIYHEKKKTTLAVSGISITFDWFLIIILSIIIGITLLFFSVNLYLGVNQKLETLDQYESEKNTITIGEIREVTGPLLEQKILKIKVENISVPQENLNQDSDQEIENAEGQ